MNCLTTPYKQLYDSFIQECFLGCSNRWFLRHEDIDERNACVTTGFAVNKDLRPNHIQSFHNSVFDNIRVIEEVLSGIFNTTNKEFNQVFPIFIREFMLGNIYVLYSEEFKTFELELAASLAEKNQEDPFERLEKSFPDTNYRLLRRVPGVDGGWRWDAVLSGVQDISIEEFLPVIDGNPKHPLRFSFNEGVFFMRLFEIFATYESQMQTFKSLFNALHKVGDVNGEDLKSIYTKIHQFNLPGVFTHTAIGHSSATTGVEDLQLIRYIPMLNESYDNIHTLLNDSLGRIGLAGDDSTKAERITTGENFRALQPNMAFKQAIKNRLDCVTERFREHFDQEVVFINTLMPNAQGIPTPGAKPEIGKVKKPPIKQW